MCFSESLSTQSNCIVCRGNRNWYMSEWELPTAFPLPLPPIQACFSPPQNIGGIVATTFRRSTNSAATSYADSRRACSTHSTSPIHPTPEELFAESNTFSESSVQNLKVERRTGHRIVKHANVNHPVQSARRISFFCPRRVGTAQAPVPSGVTRPDGNIGGLEIVGGALHAGFVSARRANPSREIHAYEGLAGVSRPPTAKARARATPPARPVGSPRPPARRRSTGLQRDTAPHGAVSTAPVATGCRSDPSADACELECPHTRMQDIRGDQTSRPGRPQPPQSLPAAQQIVPETCLSLQSAQPCGPIPASASSTSLPVPGAASCTPHYPSTQTASSNAPDPTALSAAIDETLAAAPTERPARIRPLPASGGVPLRLPYSSPVRQFQPPSPQPPPQPPPPPLLLPPSRPLALSPRPLPVRVPEPGPPQTRPPKPPRQVPRRVVPPCVPTLPEAAEVQTNPWGMPATGDARLQVSVPPSYTGALVLERATMAAAATSPADKTADPAAAVATSTINVAVSKVTGGAASGMAQAADAAGMAAVPTPPQPVPVSFRTLPLPAPLPTEVAPDVGMGPAKRAQPPPLSVSRRSSDAILTSFATTAATATPSNIEGAPLIGPPPAPTPSPPSWCALPPCCTYSHIGAVPVAMLTSAAGSVVQPSTSSAAPAPAAVQRALGSPSSMPTRAPVARSPDARDRTVQLRGEVLPQRTSSLSPRRPPVTQARGAVAGAGAPSARIPASGKSGRAGGTMRWPVPAKQQTRPFATPAHTASTALATATSAHTPSPPAPPAAAEVTTSGMRQTLAVCVNASPHQHRPRGRQARSVPAKGATATALQAVSGDDGSGNHIEVEPENVLIGALAQAVKKVAPLPRQPLIPDDTDSKTYTADDSTTSAEAMSTESLGSAHSADTSCSERGSGVCADVFARFRKEMDAITGHFNRQRVFDTASGAQEWRDPDNTSGGENGKAQSHRPTSSAHESNHSARRHIHRHSAGKSESDRGGDVSTACHGAEATSLPALDCHGPGSMPPAQGREGCGDDGKSRPAVSAADLPARDQLAPEPTAGSTSSASGNSASFRDLVVASQRDVTPAVATSALPRAQCNLAMGTGAASMATDAEAVATSSPGVGADDLGHWAAAAQFALVRQCLGMAGVTVAAAHAAPATMHAATSGSGTVSGSTVSSSEIEGEEAEDALWARPLGVRWGTPPPCQGSRGNASDERELLVEVTCAGLMVQAERQSSESGWNGQGRRVGCSARPAVARARVFERCCRAFFARGLTCSRLFPNLALPCCRVCAQLRLLAMRRRRLLAAASVPVPSPTPAGASVSAVLPPLPRAAATSAVVVPHPPTPPPSGMQGPPRDALPTMAAGTSLAIRDHGRAENAGEGEAHCGHNAGSAAASPRGGPPLLPSWCAVMERGPVGGRFPRPLDDIHAAAVVREREAW